MIMDPGRLYFRHLRLNCDGHLEAKIEKNKTTLFCQTFPYVNLSVQYKDKFFKNVLLEHNDIKQQAGAELCQAQSSFS